MVKRGEDNNLEFKFVFYNLSWWLEIQDFETLKEIEKVIPDKVHSSIIGALKWNNHQSSFNSYDEEYLGGAVYFSSQSKDLNFIESANELFSDDLKLKNKLLFDGKKIYMNKNYGWHVNDLSNNLSVIRLGFDFPDYKKDDILILQCEIDGEIFYSLYLGDLLVKIKFGVYFREKEEAELLGKMIVLKHDYKINERLNKLSYYGLI